MSNDIDIVLYPMRSGRAGRITISDVAEGAGVSVSTVSKVINDRYGVAGKTSAHVRAVIAELGYQSSLVAQSMRGCPTRVIGVLTADIEPFSVELLKGVAQAIRGTGYDIVVFSDCGQGDNQSRWERRYLARISTLTDGAILVTPRTVDVSFGGPIVAVDHNASSSTLSTVDSDNLRGSVAATAHLIKLGHRRIGFVGGRKDLASARLREEGYRKALAAAGIPFDPGLVRAGGFDPVTAVNAARELAALKPRPTAIFAANDVSALQVLRVARSMGLTVPDDLSIVGFDNVPESALSEPPLTTVDQFVQRMGSSAVEMLIGLIENPERHAEQIVLPTRLVVRGSSRRLQDS